MLIGKRFADIDGQDIMNLISERVPESQYIEYKEKPWDSSVANRKESLYDIAALANAYGGCIIVGIRTEGDIPVQVIPVVDAASQQSVLQKRAIAGVDPRIPGLGIRPVTTKDGDVLLIHVPRSGRNPHMVTLEGASKFYRRHGKDKLLMSVDEIGDAFLVTGSRVDRGLAQIARHQETAPLGSTSPLLCLASLPLLHYPRPIDPTEAWAYDFLTSPPSPPDNGGWSLLHTEQDRACYYEVEPSLEGLVKRHVRREELFHLSLSRDGMFSFRTGQFLFPPNPHEILGRALIDTVVHFLRASQALAEHLNFQGEIASYLTLANVQSLALSHTAAIPGRTWTLGEPVKTELASISPEPLTWDSGAEPDGVACRLLNIVYNAFHYKAAPLFKNGKYDPQAISPSD